MKRIFYILIVLFSTQGFDLSAQIPNPTLRKAAPEQKPIIELLPPLPPTTPRKNDKYLPVTEGESDDAIKNRLERERARKLAEYDAQFKNEMRVRKDSRFVHPRETPPITRKIKTYRRWRTDFLEGERALRKLENEAVANMRNEFDLINVDDLVETAQIAISIIPIVGDIIDISEFTSGSDFFSLLSGEPEEITATDRSISGAGIILGSGLAHRKSAALFDGIFEETNRFRKWSKRFKNSKIRTADELNEIDMKAGGREPSWLPGTEVIEGALKKPEKFVRVHGDSNAAGAWLIKEESIRGMTAEQIKLKFSLKHLPTHLSYYTVPQGTVIRRGLTNDIMGGRKGAIQYQIVADDDAKGTIGTWIKETIKIR